MDRQNNILDEQKDRSWDWKKVVFVAVFTTLSVALCWWVSGLPIPAWIVRLLLFSLCVDKLIALLQRFTKWLDAGTEKLKDKLYVIKNDRGF